MKKHVFRNILYFNIYITVPVGLFTETKRMIIALYYLNCSN
jgi:hypothetical protein